jgi:hypothetical protein
VGLLGGGVEVPGGGGGVGRDWKWMLQVGSE